MYRHGDELKQRVREANDIVEIVGATVQLKKAGKSYKGLCPFHDEKTPSFIVNPDRQTFKCFGCGEGGDVFTFVEKTERVDFKEALALLAERAGIEMTTSREDNEAAARAREQRVHLYRAQTLAAQFFASHLKSPGGSRAREYLQRRSLDAQSELWGLGYAPGSWDAFVGRYATSKPKERWLVASGLARARENKGGVYDTFRDRLMFPIADTTGRLVGFGGRMLGDGEPKYLNTPETAVFAKGRLLYGLDKAREKIGRTGVVLVVEGYTDVIRCHEHGFDNAVATLGTALTADHVRLLRRSGANKVVMVYDADEAGVRASERALEILIEADMPGSVVNLYDGLDPCEFLEKEPREEFASALEAAKDLFEFKIARSTRGRNMADINERARVAHELMQVVSKSSDRVKRALLRQRVSEALSIDERDLEYEGAAVRERPTQEVMEKDAPPEPVGMQVRAERDLAWLLVKYPEHIRVVVEDIDTREIADPLAREVIGTIEELHAHEGGLDDRTILDHLSPDAVEFAVGAQEHEESAKPDTIAGRLKAAAVALALLKIPAQVTELDRQIKEAEDSGDEARVTELLQQRQQLEMTRKDLKARGRSWRDDSPPGSEEG